LGKTPGIDQITAEVLKAVPRWSMCFIKLL